MSLVISCREKEKKRNEFTQSQNKNRGIHRANVMTHQTVQQTALFCHTLPVVLFCPSCVYKTQTSSRLSQCVDGRGHSGFTHIVVPDMVPNLPFHECGTIGGRTHQQVFRVFRAGASQCLSLAANSRTLNLAAPCGQLSWNTPTSAPLMQFPDLPPSTVKQQTIDQINHFIALDWFEPYF